MNGETVFYASYDTINDTLKYDFNQEKNFSYKGLPVLELVKHIAEFTAGIWQIYPFCEGNTRSTAVFIIKYLQTFGFKINNDAFAENSWYFRNALVRANYNDYQNGIHADIDYLERFFENLLLGYHNDLKNRYLHVDYRINNKSEIQSAMIYDSKCKNCTLEEFELLKIIKNDPAITQKKLALMVGKSERTIKTRTAALQEKGYLRRKNGKRNGHWEVLFMFCTGISL